MAGSYPGVPVGKPVGRNADYVRFRPTARSSCSLFIDDRPLMPIDLASSYSCALVRPRGERR